MRPVIEYYQQQGRLERINGDQPPEKVTAELLTTLSARR